MGLKPLTDSLPAVSVTDAKAHLRIDGDDDDETLAGFVIAATEFIEAETRSQLVTRDYLLTLDAFPASRELKVPRPPLVSVSSVKYRDAAGDEQTLDPALYVVDANEEPGRIVLKPGASWPTTDGGAACVEVRFTAGHNAMSVPYLLAQAVLLMVGHMFEHREAIITGTMVTQTPLAVQSIVAQHEFPEVF